MASKVIHWSDNPNRAPLCGAGLYTNNPPVQDKGKVTCKRCLRWLKYYANKGEGK